MQQLQSSAARGAVIFFRFLIWLSVGPACVLCLIMFINLNRYMSSIIIITPVVIVVTIAFGYFDALLSPSTPKSNNLPIPRAAVKHVLIFMLSQVILAPLILCALLFGFCALIQ